MNKLAQKDAAWSGLNEAERAGIEAAIQSVRSVYQGADHLVLKAAVEKLNEATHGLAEEMMNSAVSKALKGTKV